MSKIIFLLLALFATNVIADFLDSFEVMRGSIKETQYFDADSRNGFWGIANSYYPDFHLKGTAVLRVKDT